MASCSRMSVNGLVLEAELVSDMIVLAMAAFQKSDVNTKY